VPGSREMRPDKNCSRGRSAVIDSSNLLLDQHASHLLACLGDEPG
jgi:hypothetical protein